MTSRERLLAAWNGSGYDHPPLTAWHEAVVQAWSAFGGRITLAGDINSTMFAGISAEAIRREVRKAMEELAGTRRFILQPVDALHPDTPWEGMETVIEAWKECW